MKGVCPDVRIFLERLPVLANNKGWQGIGALHLFISFHNFSIT